jgi:hypothetical protein
MPHRPTVNRGASPGFPWNPHGIQRGPAELVYSELLTSTADPVDPAHLITKLQQHMAHLRPVLAAHHASPAKFVHSELEKYTHVFLRQDTMHQALEPPTVAPTRSYQGQRRCCNSSCAGGPSQCQPTGSSRPTSSKGPTTGTTSTRQSQ